MNSAGFGDAAAEVVGRTIELSEVPAPTFHEQRRTEILESWWTDKGLEPTVDEAGNLWAQLVAGSGPGLVVCAHLDTVFGEEVTHGVRSDGDLLVGPGVGDDTVALAALTVLPDLPVDRGQRATWLLATVAEEGLGNLAGIRHALTHSPSDVSALIAVEGNYLGRVVTTGVGSVRWRLIFTGPGGHAWEASDRPSAIHEMAGVVAGLDRLADVPKSAGRVSVNVGFVSEGEAGNARARRAEISVDLRADDGEALQELERRARMVVGGAHGIDVAVEEIGRRPAGSISNGHPLVVAAADALSGVGLAPVFAAASTDANAAYELNVPAITIGVTEGGREHTEDEWISKSPIAIGLEAMAATVVNAGGADL